jgi:hypothetical protein
VVLEKDGEGSWNDRVKNEVLHKVRGDRGSTVDNRKVAGLIPAGVSGFFIDIKSFRSHYGPGVDSTSNRNEYQEYFLAVKAAGASG